jgi:hypothetical protein
MRNYLTQIVLFKTKVAWSSIMMILLSASWMGSLSAKDTWDGTSDIWTKGDGTAANPYLVETAEQLAFISEMVNGGVTDYSGVYFQQTQDFDMKSLSWIPIGRDIDYVFKGNYDGQGFRIDNLKISDASVTYAGLFGNVSGVSIRNVNLNISMTSRAYKYAGGMVAYVGTGRTYIVDCAVKGTVSSSVSSDSDSSSYSYSGGFVGYNSGTVIVEGSISSGTVSSSSSDSYRLYSYSGGFVGYNSGTVTVEGSISSGTVSSSAAAASFSRSYSYSGGFVGYNSGTVTIEGSISSGTVSSSSSDSSSSYSGGFVGYNDKNCSIKNSYVIGEVHYKEFYSSYIGDVVFSSTNATTTTTVTNTYYLAGSCSSSNAVKKTEAAMKSVSFPIILNADSTVFISDLTPMVNNGYPIIKGLGYIETMEASKVGSTIATLNGVCKEVPDLAEVGFEYKIKGSSEYIIKKGTLENNLFSVELKGLEEDTVYQFRTYYLTLSGKRVWGSLLSFSTLGGCPEIVIKEEVSICDGESYSFGDLSYTKGGVYWDTLSSSLGCDSIVELNLSVKPTYDIFVTDTIWESGFYDFYGDSLKDAGSYTKYVPAVSGCNFVTLTLFKQKYHEIVVESNDIKMGTVEGGGVFEAEYPILLNAIPNEGYYFTEWSDGNTENPRTLMVSGDTALTAIFAAPFKVEVLSSDLCGGTVYGGGLFKKGETTRIVATTKEGYTFVKWSDGVTDKVRTITVTQDSSLVAVYEINTYSLKVVSNDDNAGLALGDGTFKYGESAKISAVPFDGYSFVAWSDSVKEAERTIVMTSNLALSAIFQKIDLTNVTLCNNDYVTISVEPLTILFNGITTEYVEVYNALSQLLYEGTAERVPVPAAGVYIVKVDDEVVKVLVSD